MLSCFFAGLVFANDLLFFLFPVGAEGLPGQIWCRCSMWRWGSWACSDVCLVSQCDWQQLRQQSAGRCQKTLAMAQSVFTWL